MSDAPEVTQADCDAALQRMTLAIERLSRTFATVTEGAHRASESMRALGEAWFDSLTDEQRAEWMAIAFPRFRQRWRV